MLFVPGVLDLFREAFLELGLVLAWLAFEAVSPDYGLGLLFTDTKFENLTP